MLVRALREPLLHFLLVGSALFALDFALRAEPSRGADAPIVVDDGLRSALAERWTASHDRAPSAQELDAAIAAWKDEEVLYRAGAARGLDKDDPRVRERVAAKMAFVLREAVVVPEPSEDELRVWYEERADQWARAELYDFSHVFISGHDDDARRRQAELLEKLQLGADPAGLGDTFSGGRRYRRRKLPDLARTFGDEFVQGMAAQEPGSWVSRTSRFGLHLLRIEKKTPAQLPTFDDARLDVRKDWEAAQQQQGFERAMAELRAQWRVVERR